MFSLTMQKQVFYLSAVIIIVNTLIGASVPNVAALDDEISLLDSVWRVVQGQRVGIDYHDPFGFGLSQVGAALWRLLGPHHYILHLTATLFSLFIAFCGCIVAKRSLTHRSDLALLFCVMLAFVLSAPSIFGAAPSQLGVSEYYNRLIDAALAVLFLQTFNPAFESGKRHDVIDILLASFLLNILFLVKISGLVVGVGILVAGCLLPGRILQRLLTLGIILLVFALMMTIEFSVAGLQFMPVIREYEHAAQARLAYTLWDIFTASFNHATILCFTLLLLLVVSRRPADPHPRLWWIGLVVVSYCLCQLALNLTNMLGPMVPLAPVAAAVLAGWQNLRMPSRPQASNPGNWWRQLHPARLADITVRDAIPFALFAYVLIPQIEASIAGSIVLVRAGGQPLIVTAGPGVNFRSFDKDYATYLNHGIYALAALNVGQEAIATLDFSNPFPLLLAARSPKGINTFWDLGINVPRGAKKGWQDVIGDASIVMLPKRPDVPESAAFLAEAARPGLVEEFTLVYEDERWSIYKRRVNKYS